MAWPIAAAMIGAGALTTAGTIYANQKNLKNTNKWNDVQVDLANTAHQREVLDLKSAGLNPILSAQGTGAPVPSLGSANISNPAQGVADGISSAADLYSPQYRAQVNNLKANTRQVNTVNSALKADREVEDLIRRKDLMLARAEFDAAKQLTGHEWFQDKKGKHYSYFNENKYQAYLNILEEGMLAEAQLKQNSNWRANLSSFVPFVSPAAIHSATEAGRSLKYTRRFFK